MWSRDEVTYCKCKERRGVRAHCPCEACRGCAVSRSTEYQHWLIASELAACSSGYGNSELSENSLDLFTIETSTPIPPPNNCNSSAESENTNSTTTVSITADVIDVDVDHLDAFDTDYLQDDDGSNDEIESHSTIATCCDLPFPDDITQVVLESVVKALAIQEDTSSSQEQFMKIINYGRDLYCKGDKSLHHHWPSTWQASIKLLTTRGYSEPKTFWVCLSNDHHCSYDVMESQTETCR